MIPWKSELVPSPKDAAEGEEGSCCPHHPQDRSQAQGLEVQESGVEACPQTQKEELDIPYLPVTQDTKTLKAGQIPTEKCPWRNKLDHYAIIDFLFTTESAMKKIEDNTLVFILDIRIKKHQVQQVVKKLYDIDKANINTLIQPDGEKAYVQLAPD
ncbi:60S ribosomal protein L23a-like [Trichosurus vulpecula]|uniref:60S ribosomal protein L23a-like n=1 Tax=Trichosurus vulpecula TaxID=9337 RepID=UPI00186B36F7|nr:60S ribosomal protein L23a-like [Trichosurus vulpecula]